MPVQGNPENEDISEIVEVIEQIFSKLICVDKERDIIHHVIRKRSSNTQRRKLIASDSKPEK